MKDKISDDLRYEMQAIQYRIEQGNAMGVNELKDLWNDLSEIVTRVDALYTTEISEEEIKKEREAQLQEHFPVFSQIDAKNKREKRYIYGLAFESGIEWALYKSAKGVDNNLLKACECFLNLEPIWMPPTENVKPEHYGEMQALVAARDLLKEAVESNKPAKGVSDEL